MKLPIITSINIFAPIWIALGLGLCFAGKLNWWTLILLILSRFEFTIKRKESQNEKRI